MTTLTTRIHGIPVVATRSAETVATATKIGDPTLAHFEVRIAPSVPWTSVPHELRSTYVSADLATSLSVAQSVVTEYVDWLWAEDTDADHVDRAEWAEFVAMTRILTTEQGI